tara:strand:- start:1816 stop:2214 length:399 start_codon:yes stop_codon:yes gene_type:complete
MSEEFEMGTSGAMAGAQLGKLFGAVGGPAGAAVGLLVGGLVGRSAKKKRKKAEQLARAAKRRSLLGRAGEIIRTESARAIDERSKYALGGLDTASGSAGATDTGTMREAVYKGEAVLAGLPGRKDDEFRSLA